MPIDYSKSKIYKIVDNSTDNIYIGSTCQTLALRLAGHVQKYKAVLKDSSDYTSSYEIIDNGDYDIILLESYPCGSKDELLARERYYIDLLKPINKMKVPKYTDPNERVIMKNKFNLENYYKHHETNLNRRKQKIVCECGREIRFDKKGNHIKTKVHATLLNQVEDN